jgi:hypothetical protein
MDKFIKDIQKIISDFKSPSKTKRDSFIVCTECDLYRYYGISEVVEELSKALLSYTKRLCDDTIPRNKEISPFQFERIMSMIDIAEERRSIISQLSVRSHTVDYFRGYISAVECIMDILNIEKK